jgi:AraC-like DNA-binding protein
MPSSMVGCYTDPESYVGTLYTGRFDVCVTEPGRFEAKYVRVSLDRLCLQQFSEALPRIFDVEFDPDRAVIMFHTLPGLSSLVDGSALSANAMVRYCREYGGALRSFGPMHVSSIGFSLADMEAHGLVLDSADVVPPRGPLIINLPTGAIDRLRRLHLAAQHLAEHAPEVIESPEAARGLEQTLLAALADGILAADDRNEVVGSRHHARIMRRFRALLEAKPDVVLHTTELCKAIGVSNRTLTTCCNETLGMGPHRYLKLRQLNLAHRALSLANPATATVTDIATAHGFWDLGRFASAHRSLFGELPSVTLQRRAGAASAPRAEDILSASEIT